MTVGADRWTVYESFVFWRVSVARLLRRYLRSGPLLDLTIVYYSIESVLPLMKMIVLLMRLAVSSSAQAHECPPSSQEPAWACLGSPQGHLRHRYWYVHLFLVVKEH